ncbi:MAG: molybdopterin-dependent oxidoreductase [Anaerolineales bacterium]
MEFVSDPHTLLCHAMGNRSLNADHGAPLRFYTPNRYGMKNPKWIVEIKVTNEHDAGYWGARGWCEQAWVKTTSAIDAYQPQSDNVLEIGGIAFAGSRSIQCVELRVDDNDWSLAELNRDLSSLSWVLWRAAVHAPKGKHQITVRAIDGNGDIQLDRRSDSQVFCGSVGYHSVSLEI